MPALGADLPKNQVYFCNPVFVPSTIYSFSFCRQEISFQALHSSTKLRVHLEVVRQRPSRSTVLGQLGRGSGIDLGQRLVRLDQFVQGSRRTGSLDGSNGLFSGVFGRRRVEDGRRFGD